MAVWWWWMTAASAETELSLERAVALAVERNPDVTSARLAELVGEISAARAKLDRYTVAVGVDGNLGLGVTHPWGGPTYDTTDAGWSAGATVGVPLYTGGRVDASIEAAQADADIAAVQRALTERELVRAAYSAYWNVRGLELRIVAAEEGLAASTDALAIIQSKADNGLAAGIDVNRSTVDLLSQQEALIAQRGLLTQARQQLVQLLALEDPEIRLTSDPPPAVEGGAALPADLLGARPELDRQERSVDRARAGVAIARSGALPTVSVQGSAQVGAAASGGGPSTELPTFDLVVPAPTFESADLGRPVPSATVGLVLTWNPFDLLRTRQLVRQAELELERTEAANASERNRLLAEIRSAQAEVEALRARFPLVHQQLQLARDNQGIVQDLYAQGSASILDLFNAQAAFRASAIQEAALAVALATAELDLRWLLGDDLLSGVSR